MENWVLLGASRGLGRAFLNKALLEMENLKERSLQISVFSRRFESLPEQVQTFNADFSKPETWDSIISQVQKLNPQRIFYFAGGGPFGRVQDKNWKDHQWAFHVSFEFPAFLLHRCLQNPQQIQQMVFVGSSVAESSADPLASSYCAAKHALKGFLTSIQQEQKTSIDLRLFSPGYMDTDLLPTHAWPRQHAGMVHSPRHVAEILWDSIHNADDVPKHFVLKSSL